MSVASIAKTYLESMQELKDEYLKETGKLEATTDELGVWAIRTRRWDPPPDLVLKKCKEDFARAMREERFNNDDGQPVRANHVARRKVDNKQRYFWADIRRTTRQHIENSFSLRLQQIIGDCRQLDRDKDYWNSHRLNEKPIQLAFDFTDDVEEGKFSGEYPPKQPR